MASACERYYEQFLLNQIPPRFFKVVLEDGSVMDKIVIPRKFVLKHGEKLPGSVSFKIPDGTTWKVDLMKTENDLWLSKGWKEFSKHYSLQRGHFLVFEYNMDSCFSVGIFEPNATEIEYHRPTINAEEPNLGRNQSQSLCDQCSNKRKRSEFDGRRESFLRPQRSSKFSVPRPLTQIERRDAIKRASERFESRNPLFKVAMQPAYLCGKLRIPYRFAKRYLQNIIGEVSLQVGDGQPRTVAFVLYPGYSHASFNSGWPAFQREYDLDVGDVMIFELIDETKPMFNVVIFRAEEIKREVNLDRQTEASVFESGSSARKHLRVDPGTESSKFACKAFAEDVRKELSNEKLGRRYESRRSRKVGDVVQQLTPEQREKAMKRARAEFKSDKPVFRVLMQPTYLYGNLRVSYQFAKRYLKETSGQVILQGKGGHSKKITFFIRYDKSHASFNAGWSAFARDNRLKLGDVVTFELIENTKFVFNVVVSRAPVEDVKRNMAADPERKASGFQSGVSANRHLGVDRHIVSSEAVAEADSKSQVNKSRITDSKPPETLR